MKRLDPLGHKCLGDQMGRAIWLTRARPFWHGMGTTRNYSNRAWAGTSGMGTTHLLPAHLVRC